MAIRHLTPDDPPDLVTGNTDSRVREMAYWLLTRDEDEVRDIEALTRTTERYWWMTFCLDTLGELPDDVEARITCRAYTWLRARAIVAAAYEEAVRRFGPKPQRPQSA